MPPKANDTLRDSAARLNINQVEDVLSGRYAFINAWMSIGTTPIFREPLALCEANSVAEKDLIVYEMHYPDRIGENYTAAHSSSHRWWYFQGMHRGEVVLIKCWDSAGWPLTSGGPAVFALHTAFEDPTTPDDACPRESIEVRTLAVF